MADGYLVGITPEKYLQQIGLADYTSGGLRLRRAALLLFAGDIQRWHPRCQVRILRVEGTSLLSGPDYNVTSDETVQGNITELLVRSWEQLRPFLAYKTELSSGARFEQRFIYPEFACREALVNAIAHRDYSIHNGVDVYIYLDRMEIRSPGSLLSTITKEQLLRLENAHESRNPLVARTLRESRLMRELGEGMKRIFQLMAESNLRTPTIDIDANWFKVTLYNESRFNPQQQAWLSLFDGRPFTELQRRIIVAGMGGAELSPADIYKAMNTDDRDTYDQEVTALRKAGVLEVIRSNSQARKKASATNKGRSSIGRFRVRKPDTITITAAYPTTRFSERSPTIVRGPAPASGTQLAVASIFVGNLPDKVTGNDLHDLFQPYGIVTDVRLMMDRVTGRLSGIGFVDMADGADRAIAALNGYLFNGRQIAVRMAKARHTQ